MGAVLQTGGALLGDSLADCIDCKLAYCLRGVAIALVLDLMALRARTPLTYIVCGSSYLALIGVFSATFVAVDFDSIGKGAAATKCMLQVCVANLSSTSFSRYVHDRLGVTAMLLMGSGLGEASILLFEAVAWLNRAA